MMYGPIVDACHRLLERTLAERGDVLNAAIASCVASLKAGRKILAFGNGGSAAEAQHFTAEMVNKFAKARPALRAVSLATDISVLTSIGNDAAFDSIFSRQIEALGDAGDVALALSTSGRSPNVLKGLTAAREKKMVTIGLTGKGGGKMAVLCDHLLDVPSSDTPRVQEVHLVVLHVIAGEIEKRIFI